MNTVLQRNIKKQLAINNISVNLLERRCGLKPSAIHNILHGRSKKPSLDIIQSIAQELDCTIEQLIRDDEKVKNSQTHTPWNADLFIQSIEVIHKIFSQKGIQPSKEQAMTVADEVYKYSLRSSQKTDERFAEWLIERYYQ